MAALPMPSEARLAGGSIAVRFQGGPTLHGSGFDWPSSWTERSGMDIPTSTVASQGRSGIEKSLAIESATRR